MTDAGVGYGDDQEQLRDAVRGFFERHSDENAVRAQMDTDRGHDPDVWRLATEQLGLPSLVIPAEHGGQGYGWVELAVVMEEAGRALYGGPLLATALATSMLWSVEASDDAAGLLEAIAAGRTATLVMTDGTGAHDVAGTSVTASRPADRWMLEGAASHVVDGHTAESLVVVARGEAGVGVFIVDADTPGLTIAPLSTMDLTRKQAVVTFTECPAVAIAEPGTGDAAIDHFGPRAAALLAAEQTGAMGRCLEMAVDYAKERHQFGRPIGSFQAVKHRCAEMLLRVDSARAVAWNAARAVAAGDEDLALTASLAAAFCSQAFVDVAGDNIQVHGGVGFTWEHPASLYYKRAKASEVLLGTPTHHRESFATAIGI
jgi:alkylation response protein AidB-like acyl-CoA dehydrogenase